MPMTEAAIDLMDAFMSRSAAAARRAWACART
jgi:hypothetical protein